MLFYISLPRSFHSYWDVPKCCMVKDSNLEYVQRLRPLWSELGLFSKYTFCKTRIPFYGLTVNWDHDIQTICQVLTWEWNCYYLCQRLSLTVKIKKFNLWHVWQMFYELCSHTTHKISLDFEDPIIFFTKTYIKSREC